MAKRKACLCKDGKKYSVKCCEETPQGQGIGTINGTTTVEVTQLNPTTKRIVYTSGEPPVN